ncbi:MAG: poly-gamma-glutamate hydrolase family protein [Syntrophobacteraceae bacterium]|nr:poly-gamma-glutamate hydrolase family protein [Syntrophobacteraceae bacterium]
MDRYASFKELFDNEVEGADYKIRSRAGTTGIALLCIHGGDIEPGTSEIADGIAGRDHTFYALEGIKKSGNKTLHITSTVFDEPCSIEIVCNSEIIVSVHGCAETEETVHIGGLEKTIKERIAKKLIERGFEAQIDSNSRFRGTDQRNVCNLCGRGMGVQIEISRGVRSKMFRDLSKEGRQVRSEVYYRFIFAVREALRPFGSFAARPLEPDGWEIIR